jgi:PadR family transcriptional regulator PadR
MVRVVSKKSGTAWFATVTEASEMTATAPAAHRCDFFIGVSLETSVALDNVTARPEYMSKDDMSNREVPYGTLVILILQTLHTMGRLHGYGIARRIEQLATDLPRLSQGSVYPALIRLEQQGWIRAEWGASETKRKVKFYSLTRAGARQLAREIADWERANALIARFREARS